VLLSTGHVEEAEDRIEGGEVHFDTIRPGDLHVYSRARNEQPHRSRWHSPLSFANVMLPPSVVADACRDAGLDYESTTFVDAFFADDLLRRSRTYSQAESEPLPKPYVPARTPAS
jgi:hypothetical protein